MHKLRFHILAVLVTFALAVGGAFAYSRQASTDAAAQEAESKQAVSTQEDAQNPESLADVQKRIPGLIPARQRNTRSALGSPIANASARVLKKPFSLYVTPETSPVPNDKFTGYHVGVDFETFDDEQDTDVPIYAICDGPLLAKNMAKGYGGVAVQSCTLEGKKVQVIYGHIRLESVAAEVGATLTRGDQIAVLGTGHSAETDGARKHLHLGIHEGEPVDIRGYVPTEEDVPSFLNAREYMASE